MKPRLFLIIAVVLLAGSLSAQENKASVQLAAAIYEEEVTGNLDKAVELYLNILKNYPDDRPVAAKTLYHLGLVNEKMGKQKASEYFTRLVNTYPDQTEMVSLAKERLNRLLASIDKPHKPTFRKINIATQLTPSVKLSPDGKNLALVADKKLWIMPLSGNLGQEFPGTPTQVNTEGIEVDWSSLSWSGDGKLIAFNDITSKEETEKENYQSIYVVDPSGGEPKEVINNYRDWRIVNYRMSLSPDGKELAYTSVENNKQHIYIKDVAGVPQKQLVDNQAREPVYSPDGKWIAYVEDKNLGIGGGNLWIIPESGGLPELVAKAGQASSPVWSPDGNTIAFLDFEKRKQINIVQVPKNSQSINNVTSIEAPEGTENIFLLAGWTPENKIGLLLITKRQFALYTLPANGGPASTVLTDGYISQPRWSPDGEQIYYTTQLNEGNEQTSRTWLASVPAKGGSGQPLPEDKERVTLRLPEYSGGNRVSPDGKMIISSAWTSEDTSAIIPNFLKFKLWKIAIDGTESKQITNAQGPYADLYPCWSPDGRDIAFLRVQISTAGGWETYDKAGIYTVNSSGGEPEILISTSDKLIFSPVWSPDGKMIAYLSKEREDPHTSHMNIINVENGDNRIVGEVPSIYVSNELAWSPDSKRLAMNCDNVIKVMNINDGSSGDINTYLEDVNIYHFDWSPDEERFVFTGWKGGDLEFWFLEDFLPELE